MKTRLLVSLIFVFVLLVVPVAGLAHAETKERHKDYIAAASFTSINSCYRADIYMNFRKDITKEINGNFYIDIYDECNDVPLLLGREYIFTAPKKSAHISSVNSARLQSTVTLLDIEEVPPVTIPATFNLRWEGYGQTFSAKTRVISRTPTCNFRAHNIDKSRLAYVTGSITIKGITFIVPPPNDTYYDVFLSSSKGFVIGSECYEG